MDPFKRAKNSPENNESTKESDAIEVRDSNDAALDSETGIVEGRVSEIAKDEASEQFQDGSKKSTTKDDKKVKQLDLSEREALREKLLKNAPKEDIMREEIKEVLLKRKETLEADVAKYSRKKDYRLLSSAIMQLRLVIRQIEELARVSYEALKEVWLKVLHRFA